MQKVFRPVDLARAAGLSTQAVRNYEALGFLPVAERGSQGYRLYTQRHLDAMQTARVVIAGFGWERARQIMHSIHQNDLPTAFAVIDAYHAVIHQNRRDVEKTLESLQTVARMFPSLRQEITRNGQFHIREVAQRVGVRTSAIRFWEEQGLVQPGRDNTNNYRLYSEQDMQLLQVVALLRKTGYGFEMIRTVLAQIAQGTAEQAVRAAENRLMELTEASRRSMEATAALWTYIGRMAH